MDRLGGGTGKKGEEDRHWRRAFASSCADPLLVDQGRHEYNAGEATGCLWRKEIKRLRRRSPSDWLENQPSVSRSVVKIEEYQLPRVPGLI